MFRIFRKLYPVTFKRFFYAVIGGPKDFHLTYICEVKAKTKINNRPKNKRFLNLPFGPLGITDTVLCPFQCTFRRILPKIDSGSKPVITIYAGIKLFFTCENGLAKRPITTVISEYELRKRKRLQIGLTSICPSFLKTTPILRKKARLVFLVRRIIFISSRISSGVIIR